MIVAVTLPITLKKMNKVDTYSYYMGYKASKDISANVLQTFIEDILATESEEKDPEEKKQEAIKKAIEDANYSGCWKRIGNFCVDKPFLPTPISKQACINFHNQNPGLSIGYTVGVNYCNQISGSYSYFESVRNECALRSRTVTNNNTNLALLGIYDKPDSIYNSDEVGFGMNDFASALRDYLFPYFDTYSESEIQAYINKVNSRLQEFNVDFDRIDPSGTSFPYTKKIFSFWTIPNSYFFSKNTYFNNVISYYNVEFYLDRSGTYYYSMPRYIEEKSSFANELGIDNVHKNYAICVFAPTVQESDDEEPQNLAYEFCEAINKKYNIKTSNCSAPISSVKTAATSTNFSGLSPHIVLSNGLKLYIGSDFEEISELSDAGAEDNTGFALYIDVNGDSGKSKLYQDVFPFYLLKSGKVVAGYNPAVIAGANNHKSLSYNVIYDSYSGGNRTVKVLLKEADFKTAACAVGYITSLKYCDTTVKYDLCKETYRDCRIIVNEPFKIF